MAEQANKSFVDTIVEAQKEMVNTATENARKLANGNSVINETVNKGSEWYNNWLDTQKQAFGQTTQKATDTANTVKENAGQMTEFYQNWYNQQMNWAKQMWDNSLNAFKGMQQDATSAAGNPTAQWNNMMNSMTGGWNSMMNNFTNAANWSNAFNTFQSNNPFNMNSWKNGADQFSGIFNQWTNLLTSSFADLGKNIQNGTAQDAYRNMFNTTEAFTKFYQMWMPMWQSIQDKTFNKDMFKQMANPELYKDIMDKYFGFMPESARQYVQQTSAMMQEAAKNMGNSGIAGYQQMRDMMAKMMPSNMGNEAFNSMLNNYNSWYASMSEAVSPITRMITPNQHTKVAAEWADIANRMMVYQIKNAGMQYMVYQQGTKVMDALAENIMNKIQHGEEISSMLSLYQEWLSISDKNFVTLFESDDYSQLMAETSALQLKLRKDIERQMEGMMSGVPVATRSEMDEMYKTIYDLKKQVRQLERMMEMESESEITEEEETTAKKAAAPRNNGKKA